MSTMIYEVNLQVDAEIAEAHRLWLLDHIEEMVAIPGFVEARLFSRSPEDEGANDQGQALWTVHYVLESAEAMDAYLAGPAARMRQDGVTRFGERFSATRRFLHPVTTAKP